MAGARWRAGGAQGARAGGRVGRGPGDIPSTCIASAKVQYAASLSMVVNTSKRAEVATYAPASNAS